jgi:hypothetical protein
LFPARRIHWAAITAALFRGAGQHPALAAFGHLSARHFSVAIHGAESAATTTAAGATSAARAATESAATATARAAAARAAAAESTATAATRTAWTASSSTVTIPTASAASVIARITASARFRPGHQVDDVVKIALLLGVAGGSVLAGQHAHQAHISSPFAHYRQGLHETRQAVAGNIHRGGYRLGFGPRAQIGRGRRFLGRSLARRRFICCRRFRTFTCGLRLFRWLAPGFSRRLATGLSRRLTLGAGIALSSSLGLCLWCGCGRRLRGWMVGPVGLQSIGSLPQENPREFGDGLHERVLGVVGGPF